MAKRYIDDNNREFASESRTRIFSGVIIIFALVVIFRLIQLQLLSDTFYSQRSDAQYIKKVKIRPHRGKIFDKDGNLIVFNDLSYAVVLTPVDFRSYSIPLLCKITGVESWEINKVLRTNVGGLKFQRIKILSNVDYNIVSQLEEFKEYLPGIDIETETKRVYDLPCNMAHILGYTREISKEQLEAHPFYKMGDIIGQAGIEASYDNILRGREGFLFYAVNNRGDKVDAFDTKRMNIKPVNGSDLFLTIDMVLQTRAEELLRGKRGAIIALNPNNGEILALASGPDFNITKFSGKVDNDYLVSLYQNKSKPMFNRAVGAKYPPGSTWKMMIGVAGLEEGIITPTTPLLCTGSLKMGTRSMACHGAHGNISIRSAIMSSCNTFFGRLGIRLGIDKFVKWGRLFGFGSKTGIDIAGESEGLMPDHEYLRRRYKNAAFAQGRMANFGIGQGEILVTPIQLAVYVSALANGGNIIQPHIVSQIKDSYTGKTYPVDYAIRRLNLAPEIISSIKDGMFRVVNSGGTGGSAFIPGKSVCGKTGTAENPHGPSHSLFVCFAPREKPEIAIAVIVENVGAGAETAAPYAREIMYRHFYKDWFLPNKDNEFISDSTVVIQ